MDYGLILVGSSSSKISLQAIIIATFLALLSLSLLPNYSISPAPPIGTVIQTTEQPFSVAPKVVPPPGWSATLNATFYVNNATLKPWPFNVTISDGVFQQAYSRVAKLAVPAPLTGWYTFAYAFGPSNSSIHVSRMPIPFNASETRFFKTYALEAGAVQIRTPMISMEETGANPILKYTVEPNCCRITGNVTLANPYKLVAVDTLLDNNTYPANVLGFIRSYPIINLGGGFTLDGPPGGSACDHGAWCVPSLDGQQWWCTPWPQCGIIPSPLPKRFNPFNLTTGIANIPINGLLGVTGQWSNSTFKSALGLQLNSSGTAIPQLHFFPQYDYPSGQYNLTLTNATILYYGTPYTKSITLPISLPNAEELTILDVQTPVLENYASAIIAESPLEPPLTVTSGLGVIANSLSITFSSPSVGRVWLISAIPSNSKVTSVTATFQNGTTRTLQPGGDYIFKCCIEPAYRSSNLGGITCLVTCPTGPFPVAYKILWTTIVSSPTFPFPTAIASLSILLGTLVLLRRRRRF